MLVGLLGTEIYLWMALSCLQYTSIIMSADKGNYPGSGLSEPLASSIFNIFVEQALVALYMHPQWEIPLFLSWFCNSTKVLLITINYRARLVNGKMLNKYTLQHHQRKKYYENVNCFFEAINGNDSNFKNV